MSKKRALVTTIAAGLMVTAGVLATRPTEPCVMRGPKQPPGVCRSLTKGYRVEKSVPFPAKESAGDCLPAVCR